MPYLYLFISIVTIAMQTILATYYNRKNEKHRDITPLYNLIEIITLFALWSVLFAFDGAFNPGVLIYSLMFGVGFAAAMFGMINALKTGPVALTTLFIQFSLIGTTIYGFFAWGESVTLISVIGLLLASASLVFCLYKKGDKGTDSKKISPKWLIYVTVAFVGNMGCTVIQREQQTRFNGEFGNQTMSVAMLIAMIMFIIMYMRSDRSDTRIVLKGGWFFPVLAGVSNLLANMCVMLLAVSNLAPSLIYSSIAILTLAITMLFSLFAFKERMTAREWVGVVLGVAAVALLSI